MEISINKEADGYYWRIDNNGQKIISGPYKWKTWAFKNLEEYIIRAGTNSMVKTYCEESNIEI